MKPPLVRPVIAYADLEHALLEQRRLFRERPLVLGLSCEIPSAGDFFTAT